MKIAVVKVVHGSRYDIEVSHNNESLLWHGKPYDKTELFKDRWDSLKYINLYWKSLPLSTQDEIFEIYKKIRDVFYNANDIHAVMVSLYQIVKTLLDDYHDLAEILSWVKTKSDIIVPSDIKEAMEYEAGSNITSEKTYLRDDYLELIAMAISCQTMIPVWCEYIRYAGPVVGSDFKEWQALRLMSHAKLWRSGAMNMLTRYVALHSGDISEDDAIMRGICREDLPKFNATPVIIRRVAIGDLSGHNPAQYFVKYIYSYTKQMNNNPKGLGRNQPSSRIKPKRDPGEDRGGVDELSTLEGYKSQPKVCIGDSESLRFFCDDPKAIANAIDETIPVAKLKLCLQSIRALSTNRIDRTQKILTQWFCKPAIPPRGIDELTRTQLLNVMAACQAALWHWGNYHVALLLTAIPDEGTDEGDESSLMLSDSFDMSTKSKQLMQDLFPYEKGGKRANAKKASNPGIDCIESITAMLHTREWLSFAPAELKALNNPPVQTHVFIDPRVRDLLVESFVNAINTRRNSNAQ